MTSSQSTTRLSLYVGAAVLTSLLPDLNDIKSAILNGVPIIAVDYILMAVKASLAGVVTARAFIDKSPAEVQPTKDQP